MDKKRFLELAPYYYAIAIVEHLQSPRTLSGAVSRSTILRHFTTFPDEGGFPGEQYCYLEKAILFDRAISLLLEWQMIRIIPDDFGPPIYMPAENLGALWDELGQARDLPFFRYNLIPDRENWLRSALESVNKQFNQLGIEAEDFEKPDREWEPLPLDRDDQTLREAIIKLDDAIEQVRVDNGYAVTVPEERNYVLERLSSLADRLKHGTHVSYAYVVRNGLEPLNTLIRRFAKAALEISASAARGALLEWLKQHGIKLLQGIFGS
jgi:hypothetical protein